MKPAIASGKTEDIKDVLTAYAFDLFLDDRYISEATAAEAAKLLLDYSNNRLTVENAESVINKAVAIAALEKGAITNIFDEAEIFDLENSKLKDVYSKEKPITPIDNSAISCKQNCICPPGTARKRTQRRQVPGSVAFVPSVVGLIIAGEIIKDLTDLN